MTASSRPPVGRPLSPSSAPAEGSVTAPVPDDGGRLGGDGLSAAEARARFVRDGPNELPVARGPAAWRQLVRQLTHFFALMLWVAGGFAVVAGLTALGIAIFAVVVINAVFAFWQEHRAERAAAQLRNLLPRRATVVRDGHPLEVDASELVLGDLVVLAAGDRIPADMTLLEVHHALVDTSTLTGESVPEPADVGSTAWSGTFLVEGEARAEVVATGASTRLAGIAALTHSAVRPPSPLATELHRLVKVIAVVAVSVGLVFFGISLLVGTPPSEGVVFGIGVTVALVPEGLLPTVTLSLAIGAQRMARRQALVRRLESVETLGSTTVVCTDKTGTLTENRMEVVEVWTPVGVATVSGDGYAPEATVTGGDEVLGALPVVADVARRCSTGSIVSTDRGWEARGDPMEAAIDAFARRVDAPPRPPSAGPDAERRFPFDPRRRVMSIAGAGEVVAKGAPDALLARCTDAPPSSVVEDMARRGLRVLAVARREWTTALPDRAEEAEAGLTLLGLLGFEDPPRPEVRASIDACRSAGVAVAMITGDHPETARAVADEVGLLRPDAPVLVGRELPTDEDLLGALLDHDGVVVARASPEDKLRIARALQRRGHVVAMTGDGVNDGPALQEADIGIAMGRSGTDVAREASDLVLLDDDFTTIVTAVAYGRSTFANIRHFLTYHLTDNVAELTPFLVWALSGGRFPLALTVMQVLALDIGTDTLAAVALGAEPPSDATGRRGPVHGRFLDRVVAGRAFGLLGPTEALVSMSAFLAVFVAAGWRPGEPFPVGSVLYGASGAAFAAVVVGQAANAFACRSSTRWAGAGGLTANPLLLWAVAVDLVVGAVFVLVPPLADLLRQQPPPLIGLLVAVLAVPALIGADAWEKSVRAGRARRRPEIGPRQRPGPTIAP